MTTLGIDPSIRSTGWAILRGTHKQPQVIDYGEIKIPRSLTQSQALASIHQHTSQLIRQHQVSVLAIESIIYVQSLKTAISMGSSRAAPLIAAAAADIDSFEYSPTRIKQAITGKGQAKKDQVAFMIRALLGLRETPAADAADALAIALTHLQAETSAQSGLKDRRQI